MKDYKPSARDKNEFVRLCKAMAKGNIGISVSMAGRKIFDLPAEESARIAKIKIKDIQDD